MTGLPEFMLGVFIIVGGVTFALGLISWAMP